MTPSAQLLDYALVSLRRAMEAAQCDDPERCAREIREAAAQIGVDTDPGPAWGWDRRNSVVYLVRAMNALAEVMACILAKEDPEALADEAERRAGDFETNARVALCFTARGAA